MGPVLFRIGRRASWAVALIFIATVAAAAQTATAGAEAKLLREYRKLQAQAERHQTGKQAEDWAKMAALDFQLAEMHYAAQQPAAGRPYLDDAVQLADRAMAGLRAEFAHGKTNQMKQVELRLQEISYGLGRIAQQVPSPERAPLQAMDQHFAALDAEVLQMMFTPKSERP